MDFIADRFQCVDICAQNVFFFAGICYEWKCGFPFTHFFVIYDACATENVTNILEINSEFTKSDIFI